MKKRTIAASLTLVLAVLAAPAYAASEDMGRDQSDVGKMLHKLGRGVTNVLTCWVEIPRTVAREWERTDPATGIVLGTAKGLGWGFTRLATGVYETFTFPFPIPADYEVMIEPEFVVTDVWGDPIPEISELDSNDPATVGSASYPNQFRF
jgi:putative exosortase-associated protein (TIGR04073 family)